MQGIIICLAILVTGPGNEPGRAADDSKEIEGAWTCVSMERNGAPVPPDRYKGGRLVMAGERFSYYQNGRLFTQGVRKLDASRKPRELDDTHTLGPFKGKTYLGIYELDGDTLKTCNGTAGQARPTEFTTKPGSGRLLIVYKRESKKGDRSR
ncbi:MAG: hypothetical protein NVSMB9_00260 [Isosphaeraceae bacterium]